MSFIAYPDPYCAGSVVDARTFRKRFAAHWGAADLDASLIARLVRVVVRWLQDVVRDAYQRGVDATRAILAHWDPLVLPPGLEDVVGAARRAAYRVMDRITRTTVQCWSD